MIAIFRKSAVDLRKNARDRPCIAFVKNRIGQAQAGRWTAVRQALQGAPSAGRADRPD
ncbi:hypothetical protein [Burkholderia cenocepacia]|uniref:hypothetical protein n=1 Tax=Burkholderia cenocepacia TaxID=95486 RepID=UPI000AB42B0B|nr:hypothetical protein [Burkholderia cenocepacia]MBR7982455.1 hypothetical protein [Burkholderia cenocepacia]HDR9798138.1 hypothetical protein [Burkholderia cenocepacia]